MARTELARAQLDALRREASHCRACPLWEAATQTVFGEGSADALILFVGEQPGDQEDRVGRPFIGPAGRLFDKAMEAAGIARARTYVTNAVKHFKFMERGKRRLHKRPNAGEIWVCRRWLLEEIETVRPSLVVALGATAARSLAGRPLPIGANRGKVLELADGRPFMATIHPSSLLRTPDPGQRRVDYGRFVDDLRMARRWSDNAIKKPRPSMKEPVSRG